MWVSLGPIVTLFPIREACSERAQYSVSVFSDKILGISLKV